MKTFKTIQVLWYYFRMGHGLYLSFPIGFFGFVVVVYQLALRQIPVFASLHLWGFTLIFGTGYALAAAGVGYVHMRTQNWTEAEVAAPQSPYEYRMKPFGREGRLGMPSQLMGWNVAIRTYEWMDAVSKRLNIDLPPFEEFIAETKRYRKMTETLLEGGEVR